MSTWACLSSMKDRLGFFNLIAHFRSTKIAKHPEWDGNKRSNLLTNLALFRSLTRSQ
jgi:hypothetical protein